MVHVPKAETAVLVRDEFVHELENVISLIEEEPSVQGVYINTA
jgi:hypothetical protein